MIDVKNWLDSLEEKRRTTKLSPCEQDEYNFTKLNYDPRTKEIGDYVVIWDASFLVDGETDLYIEDSKEIFKILKSKGIVIEVGNEYEVVTDIVNDFQKYYRIYLNLVLYFPELKKRIRTHSEFVKLYSNHK
jgi:hypothetical protein